MWINTRFQCSHWGNVILWSAVILNRALGEQLTPQLWLLAGVYSPSSPFSSKFLTAWGAWGKLCHGWTISFSAINMLVQCWRYQESWEGGRLKCHGFQFTLHKRREKQVNERNRYLWVTPFPWELGTQCLCTHVLFVPVSAVPTAPVPAPPLPLILPLQPALVTHLINNPHYSVSGAPKGNRSLPSKVLPPLGLPCFPSTHPSAPSSPRPRTVPVCSHNSILGFSRPPADPVRSSCKNTAVLFISLVTLLLTGGAGSSKGEGSNGRAAF